MFRRGNPEEPLQQTLRNIESSRQRICPEEHRRCDSGHGHAWNSFADECSWMIWIQRLDSIPSHNCSYSLKHWEHRKARSCRSECSLRGAMSGAPGVAFETWKATTLNQARPGRPWFQPRQNPIHPPIEESIHAASAAKSNDLRSQPEHWAIRPCFPSIRALPAARGKNASHTPT